MKMQFKEFDISGKTFGNWTALDKYEYKNNIYFWECKCSCGTTRFVNRRSLIRNLSLSCGKCVVKTHGLSKVSMYQSWAAMMTRVYNKNHIHYENYGGRGIIVCERWHDVKNFYKDMGDKPNGKSLDRIDVNGNYDPSNCKWSTSIEQSNNTRTNRKVIYEGSEYTVSELSRKLGIKYTTLKRRLDLGNKLDAKVK